jgi:hypothetical protein
LATEEEVKRREVLGRVGLLGCSTINSQRVEPRFVVTTARCRDVDRAVDILEKKTDVLPYASGFARTYLEEV